MGLTSGDLDKIRKVFHEESKNVFNEDYLKSVTESILESIAKRYDDIIKTQKTAIVDLTNRCNELAQWKSSMEARLDANEQFSRSLNIRIFGLEVEENEDLHKRIVQLFKSKLKVNSLSEADMKKCHRIMSKNVNIDRPRPPATLVRFFRDKDRDLVLKKRSLLKSSGI